MAEYTGDFEKDGTATPSDQVIRRFLLGSLSGEEQARFEASLIASDNRSEDLEARVRAAEFELVDEYAFERLSARERELFEKKFLVTHDRQRKLEVSAALRNQLAARAASRIGANSGVNITARERILSWLGFNRPALGLAIAFALVVLFAGVVWLAVKNRRVQEPAIAKREPVVMATPENSHPVQPSPTPEVTVSPKPTPKTTATPAEADSTSVVATFLLLPNALRDGGKMTRVTIPKGPPGDRAIVRMQLALEVDQPGSHSAELITAEGVSVFVANKLKASTAESTTRVVFEVPARLLQPGDYQVKLNWIVGGSVTSGGRYYFRVTQ